MNIYQKKKRCTHEYLSEKMDLVLFTIKEQSTN